jgi:tetratricopeptide (TPR) repeat protein
MKKIVFLIVLVIMAAWGSLILFSNHDVDKQMQYFNSGHAKIASKDYTGAIKDFDTMIKMNFNCAEAFEGRAEAKWHLKEYKSAISECDKALQVLAFDSVMEKMSKLSGKPTNNPKEEDKAWTIDGRRSRMYFEKAMCKTSLGDYKNALDDINKSIKLYNGDCEFYRVRAFIKIYLNDPEGAAKDIDESLKIKPDFAYGYNDGADIKNKAGDYAGALKDINKAISMDPKQSMFYCTRGETESNQKNYIAAIKDFNKSIKLDPESDIAYYSRGLAKIQIKQKQDAIEDLKKAAELGNVHAAEKLIEIQDK